jgi:nucleosome assembly protein 1-like 1
MKLLFMIGEERRSEPETETEANIFVSACRQLVVSPAKKSSKMSSNVPISSANNITAPTPQNTPLTQAPIALGLSRPTVPAISEDNEEEGHGENDAFNLSEMKTQMLGIIQGKLAGLVGKSSGYIETLPIEVKLNIEALKGIQVKQNELQNQYKRECLELEKKVSVGGFLRIHRSYLTAPSYRLFF